MTVAAMSLALAAEKTRPATAPQAGNLFQVTNLWNVHFRFSPEAWEAMPPEENEGGMFGGGGFRPGAPGGPQRGGPGGGRFGPGPGGPPGGFGPGMFLAPTFLKNADANSDEKVTAEEFHNLAGKWFSAWDKKNQGFVGEDELRDGLNSVITFPGPGGPPGGQRGPGRPGGPGGPNLQGAEGKRNGLASAAGIEFKYVKGNLRIGDTDLKDVAVRYKGNGTWMGSRFDKKRSMKVNLNEYVKGQKFGGELKLNFHNCVTDASYMNEVLSHRLYRDAGVPASRTAYARVYVDVPGKHNDEFFGLYSVVENVDSSFAADRFGTKKGAILKPVTREPFEYLGEDWSAYNQTYDPKTELSAEQKRRVIDFCKLVSKANDAEFEAKMGDYLDLDEFARYMAVTVWLSTLDSILTIGQNYYVYLHPTSGKLSFIPWDLDHSFGQFFMMGSQDQREHLSIQKPWQGENRFISRVYKVAAFQKLYRARMEEFSKTIFQADRFVQQVDEIAVAIRSAVKDESGDKLERFDKVVAGEPVGPGGFGPPGGGRGGPGRGPGGGGPFGNMQPAKPIKGFVKARAESVQKQLAGKEAGQTLDEGFGGPGGPRGFGPGNFLAGMFQAQLDADKSGTVTKEEFVKGFDQWFKAWDKEKKGVLTEDQLREGLNGTLTPAGFGNGPGGPGGPEGPNVRPGGGPGPKP